MPQAYKFSSVYCILKPQYFKYGYNAKYILSSEKIISVRLLYKKHTAFSRIKKLFWEQGKFRIQHHYSNSSTFLFVKG